MKVASGTYTGNGSSGHAITGVGFSPLAVMAGRTNSTSAAVFIRTSSMSAGGSTSLSGGAVLNDRISSLDSDGFTLGNNSDVNNNGSTHFWIAFGDDGAGDISEISYTGNGSAGHAFTTPGFPPALVIVVSASSRNHHWKTPDMSSTQSRQFNGVPSTTAITSLDATGFTVGTSNDVNANGETFYALCFKATSQFATFAYTGNGVDNRNVGSLGFTPTIAWTNVGDGGFGFRGVILRTTDMATDEAKEIGNSGAGTSNLIQDFGVGTIQVGTQDYVNANGWPYVAVAWTNVSAARSRSFVAGMVG